MGSKPSIDPLDDGDNAGKIYVGGLANGTTYDQLDTHFGNYGKIRCSLMCTDRHTGRPRGFGFVTYEDPSAVDKVISEDSHVINGKRVVIGRAIPKGSEQAKELKRKEIFVGGIPRTVTDDELKDFFSKHGEVIGHRIKRDRETNRSRGFGFVTFKSEEVVEELLSNGNKIDMAGTKVEIKRAEPKKPSGPPSGPAYGPYGSFHGGYGYRHGPCGNYGGGYYVEGHGLGGYVPPGCYSNWYEPYGRGFGGVHSSSGPGGYAQGGQGYGGYGVPGYSGGYDSGSASSYGGPGAVYGRGGYSSSSRFHPYRK